jgi:molecular chaperone GrpE
MLAEAQARSAEFQDSFLRAKADTENMRRRAQEDIARAHKFAIESFAEAMVPVKDSLEMALKVEPPSIESLKEGVEMTLKQLSSAFEKNRLLEINPSVGEKLDPMKHQAISMVPADQEANTIAGAYHVRLRFFATWQGQEAAREADYAKALDDATREAVQ